MAYTERYGVGNFVPNGSAVLATDSLTATGDHGEHIALTSLNLRRIYFVVTTLVVGTSTDPVVTFTRRPTPGSATGESIIGTLAIPDATAVGKILFKDVDVVLDAGDSLELSVSVAALGGTPAGNGLYGWDANHCPDDPNNEADVSLSV